MNAWYSLIRKFNPLTRARWGQTDTPNVSASTGETPMFDAKPNETKTTAKKAKVVDDKKLSVIERINVNLEKQMWLGGQLPT